MSTENVKHPIILDYLEEDDLMDINQVDDPTLNDPIDYDARYANEEGDEPIESVGLSPEDFIAPTNSAEVLEQVRLLVEARCKKSLGGPLIASQLKGYCMVTVEELQVIEAKEKLSNSFTQ